MVSTTRTNLAMVAWSLFQTLRFECVTFCTRVVICPELSTGRWLARLVCYNMSGRHTLWHCSLLLVLVV